jgi:predicted cupin superfamily sugar epimerase
MHPRALELIRHLDLAPHPEGGFFSRVHLSKTIVTPSDGRGPRRAFSAIYFVLVEGTFSRWHRVRSDEAWHHYEGSPVDLLSVPAIGGAVVRHTLGPLSAASAPLHVIPGGSWQAAHSLGPYSFVGCSLGPGFEYDDFVLLSDIPEIRRPEFEPASILEAYL